MYRIVASRSTWKVLPLSFLSNEFYLVGKQNVKMIQSKKIQKLVERKRNQAEYERYIKAKKSPSIKEK